MVTITPQALPPPLPGTTSPTPVITLTNPSAALALLGGSSAVQVAVTASQPTSAGAVLLLQVAGQTIEAKSPVSVQPGTIADLKLIPGSDPPKAQLLLADAKPATTQATGTPAGAGATARAGGEGTTIDLKGSLQATVIRGVPSANAAAAQPGAAATAAVATTAAQATPATAGNTAAPTGAATTTATVLPAGQSPSPAGGTAQSANPATQATTLPTGATLTVRPLAGNAAPSADARQVVSGTIIRTPAGSASIVNTPGGILAVRLPDPPGPGGSVRLEILDIRLPPAPLPLQGASSSGAGGLGAALADILQAVARANPAAAAEIASRLPQAGPQLAASLTGMVAGLRQGQLSGALADPAIRLLERLGRTDLLGRARDEAGAARRTVGEGSDWRAYNLPFLNGQEIEPVKLYLQYPENPEGEPMPDAPVKRFLIDLDLSRIGPMQIDGLIGEKSLDVILRTDEAMPAPFRDDLNLVYIQALEAVGRTGRLAFHPGEPRIRIEEPVADREGFFV